MTLPTPTPNEPKKEYTPRRVTNQPTETKETCKEPN